MNNEYINAIDAAKELGLYLKLVTSTKCFDKYNSFFNIYYELEEPCRRIVVLTPYKDLEEVYDNNPGEKIIENTIIDNNIWLKEYPLITNPKVIDFNDIKIHIDELEKLKNSILSTEL